MVTALTAAAAEPGVGTAYASHTSTDSADEVIFWTGCDRVMALSDADLDAYEALGVDGFVCQVGRLRGMGGDQDFTDNPGADLGAPNYRLQRSLRDSRIVERAGARGMKLYLGTYFVNYFNHATPLKEWFDDAGWAKVTERLRDLAGAARLLGFAGIAVDQELYNQQGGVATATWSWDYPGNAHSEAEVRAQARLRGRQVMAAIVEEFPNVDMPIYHVHLPGTWGELVRKEVNGVSGAYAKGLDVDFLAGMLNVEGYGTVRILNVMLQKSAHITNSWDTAMQYESNQVMALLSREVDNWEYASSRLHWMPFSWLNAGPSPGPFDDPRPVDYVERQLQAMRKWGMGRMFPNFVYGSLKLADYARYADALRSASSPGQVDGENPTLTLSRSGPTLPTVEGTAHDNLAIRAVRWEDDQGDSGVARLSWEILSGNPAAGYQWRMQWSIPASEVSPSASRMTIIAEDIKGHTSAPLEISWPPPSTSSPPPVETPEPEPPDTWVTAAAVTRSSATFAYRSSDREAGFECKLDARRWTRCSPPSRRYEGLTGGQHVFAVRAVSASGMVDPSPATRRFKVSSARRPATGADPARAASTKTLEITSKPPKRVRVNGVTAALSFELTGAAASLRCRLDARRRACGDGPITFRVRARRRWTRHRFVVWPSDGPGDGIRYGFRVRRR